MIKFFILPLLLSVSFILNGQIVADHPDLQLHGKVTWLSDTKISVEYDWSNDSMLLDWTPTKGSELSLQNSLLTIKGGMASVRSMKWKQMIQCSRISVQRAKAINSSVPHLNFTTNVLGWTGYDFNPPGIIGLLYKSSGNLWLENSISTSFPGSRIELGVEYTIEINISGTTITTLSSVDNVLYTGNLTSLPDLDRQVAVGGWGGDTQWGKLVIEGEITPSFQVPPDMMVIQTIGADFAPVIEVTGTPVIEWIFDDSTTSSSATPSKSYGAIGLRNNYLRVTPWTALTGINVGYDAGDGGYGNFALVENQNVSGFINIALASNLHYLCTSHNPLDLLDLRGLTELRFIESLFCMNLKLAKLDTHPYLERICVENCNLDSLDISGCSALEDLRASRNNYNTINWGSAGLALWHLCVRTNPRLIENLPALTQFPLLRELLTWDDNQTGSFVCHSPVIRRIDSYDNHYTSADVSGCSELKELSLSGSQLDALDLGTAANINYLRLTNCGLDGSQVNYVLKTLDDAGLTGGYLELEGNEGPTADGNINLANLKSKGWTIKIEAVTGILDINDDALKVIVNRNSIMIPLIDDYISGNAAIYNSNGNMLVSKLIEYDNIVFDTSLLSPGVYIIALTKNESRITAKISLVPGGR